MKKRLFCILLALGMIAALAACGDGGEDPSGTNTGGQTLSTPNPDSYVFAVSSANGYIVKINDNMADVLKVLGEPKSYYEAASCAFEGMDKFYTYSGFQITTEPGEGGKDYINSIRLMDDSVTTREGVHIGCSVDDVTAAYGEGRRMENVIRYTKGDSAMNFILEDGKVVSIEYLPA